ncbi:MAG: 16S rRNA (adenine(1518)-N(6)/adenine(1519)-N(6))-dimethyltransferase RsmA [Patescibacteria group bacterium]|nr:16S rRNA (adenine(1518)-N(6)/adenine(1519)-N(6))-dimethyltransferase RsmA [Patescibacteria group bacterium]
MTLLSETKLILNKNKISLIPKRGQNFLINQEILNKIIEASNLKSSDIILEVGPGLGILTKELAKKVKKVIAVEIDKKLVSVLKNELKKFKNVEIIQEDILQFSIFNFQFSNYKIVANLPYNITSRVIKNFLENENSPKEMILMVQKEVAERITARQGKMSILGVACQFFADCEIVLLVDKNNFFPIPKVDSAIIKLKMKKEKGKTNNDKFFKIVKAGFSRKRKKLKSNLLKTLKIDKIKIDNVFEKIGLKENTRAQELSVQDWKSLTILLNNCV